MNTYLNFYRLLILLIIKITFSECISLFSMEIMEDANNKENSNKDIIDKINNKNIDNGNESRIENNVGTENNNNINTSNPVSLLDKICLE